jgi:ABC-2 type transport system ATP-binding protein
MEELESRYLEVVVHPEQVAGGRVLKPIYEHQGIGSSVLLFDLRATAANREQVASLGQVRTPSITDLYLAMLGNTLEDKPGILADQAQGVAK